MADSHLFRQFIDAVNSSPFVASGDDGVSVAIVVDSGDDILLAFALQLFPVQLFLFDEPFDDTVLLNGTHNQTCVRGQPANCFRFSSGDVAYVADKIVRSCFIPLNSCSSMKMCRVFSCV